jgi:hypothetical protein
MTSRLIPRKDHYDSRVWGPHYWFFLHTVAMSYPDHANAVTRRKYYDLIQNMPLFIPNAEMGNKFSHLLDKYPVTPYLGKRESFIRWTVFIHNKMNIILGKPEMDLEEAVRAYEDLYVPTSLHLYGGSGQRKYMVAMLSAIVLALLLVAYMVYS